jgi:hypothetical protein
MSAISHILVLSQPEFVQRRVEDYIAEQQPAPITRLGAWLRKRVAF